MSRAHLHACTHCIASVGSGERQQYKVKQQQLATYLCPTRQSAQELKQATGDEFKPKRKKKRKPLTHHIEWQAGRLPSPPTRPHTHTPARARVERGTTVGLFDMSVLSFFFLSCSVLSLHKQSFSLVSKSPPQHSTCFVIFA